MEEYCEPRLETEPPTQEPWRHVEDPVEHCLNGHLLLSGMPGTGKTHLARQIVSLGEGVDADLQDALQRAEPGSGSEGQAPRPAPGTLKSNFTTPSRCSWPPTQKTHSAFFICQAANDAKCHGQKTGKGKRGVRKGVLFLRQRTTSTPWQTLSESHFASQQTRDGSRGKQASGLRRMRRGASSPSTGPCGRWRPATLAFGQVGRSSVYKVL